MIRLAINVSVFVCIFVFSTGSNSSAIFAFRIIEISVSSKSLEVQYVTCYIVSMFVLSRNSATFS